MGAVTLAIACRREPSPPRFLPEVEGTIAVDGLSSPVRIVRDRWGVPHVYAESRDDVFFAQGFVQAEDRLFQMDLWRRAAQGRIAEVLGANFIDRDLMTRRLQYHDDFDAEWASYGPDARPMAEAFVRGINAWIAAAGDRTPELFALAGWKPEPWSVNELLDRTDSYDRDGTIAHAIDARLPTAVVDSVRRAAVPPFFTGLASAVATSAVPRPPAGPSAPAVLFDGRDDGIPSAHYLIHLRMPNWNAIGATRPWRPGLATGHDASNIWNRPEARIRATIRSEALDLSAGRTVTDTFPVKGRTEPFVYQTQITAGGVVIATDRAAGRQFVLDWAGFKAGTASAFSARPSTSAGENGSTEPTNYAGFAHPLAITTAARSRLNLGPFKRSDYAPLFEVVPDRNVWDASRAMNAPGQSEWPESGHYSDLAALWESGSALTLAYTDAAVKANAESTLTLVPRRRR